jgi:hypothetical protein
MNAPNIPEQSSWCWCNKCQGMFWAGPVGTLVPLGCKSIQTLIQELEADKVALQEQLQTASTAEKPPLVAAINNLSQQISAKKAELNTCVETHRLCPAGGADGARCFEAARHCSPAALQPTARSVVVTVIDLAIHAWTKHGQVILGTTDQRRAFCEQGSTWNLLP